MNLQGSINDLFNIQKKEWPLLRDTISHLQQVEERTFTWSGDFKVRVQYNPKRMVSSTASVDKETIRNRSCFLCEANRPIQQKGITFLNKYIILCNPYPILHNHLTIPLLSHVPQRIGKKIEEMLLLSEQLPDYVIFYNGPASGASAPDHFHFQAGLKTDELLQGDNELRSCMMIVNEDKNEVVALFNETFNYLRSLSQKQEEPMLNLIAYISNNQYHLHIFPRKAHRSTHFYKNGSKQLLISPGALDMAGLMITVRESDFNKLTKSDIEEIYSEVSLPII